MAQPYVYDKGAESFDNFGECGELTATECVFEEIANGMSELTLTHPYDVNGRWSYLKEGNILKAEVPVRTLPPADSGAIQSSVEIYTVTGSAKPADRAFYSKSKKGRKKKALPVGTQVTVTKHRDARYYGSAVLQVKKRKKTVDKTFTGWVPEGGVTRTRTEIIESDPAAIESLAPSVTVRDQLFRIYRVNKTEQEVQVSARHVFYDALGDLTSYKNEGTLSCQEAIDGILAGCYGDSDLHGTTDMADERAYVDWTRVSPVEALLDPEEGVVNRWGGEIARDDYDFCILSGAGLNRGIRIEYGKNLLGVDCEIDTSDVVTRVVPVGRTRTGEDLLLAAGEYATQWGPVIVDEGRPWVDSPARAGESPVPHIEALAVSEAQVGGGLTRAQAMAMLAEAAMARFQRDEADLPALSVKVNFRLLGETMEYQQYRALESIHLYDRVRVYHPRIGVDVLAKVASIAYDVLLESLNAIELQSLRANLATASVMSWQVRRLAARKLTGPLNGALLQADSVGADALSAGAVAKAAGAVVVDPTLSRSGAAADAAAVGEALAALSDRIDALT